MNRNNNKTVTTVTKTNQPPTKPRQSRQRQRSAPPTRQNSRQMLVRPTPIPRPRLSLPMAAKHYYHCRIDPFSAPGGSSIPDASGGKKITYEHRQYYDVTVSASGNVKIMLMPCISNPLWFKDTNDSAASGSVFTDGLSTTLNSARATTTGGWVAPPYSEYKNYVNNTPNEPALPANQNPWGATHARIISQAVKFTYTGQAMAAAGIATVFPNASEISSTTSRNVGLSITDYAPNGLASGSVQAINTVLTQAVDIDWTAKPIPGVGQYRVVDGFVVLNKKISGQHEFTDIPNSLVVLTESDSTSALRASLASGGGSYVGVAMVDPHWMTPFIQITGMTAVTSFRLEALTCVEYLLNASSAFAPMAKDSPSISPNLLLSIDKKIADLPISGPPNFFKNALRILLTQAGNVTSLFAGPPIGRAVGTITRAFRDTFL